MNIAEPFIRRPIMTTLVMASILIFGIIAYRSLAVSDLPNVDFPTIQVSANLPGANPDTMAAAVATPLEKQFSTIAGIDSMTSTSTLGGTTITLQFDLSRNIDGAAQDVEAAISRVQGQLPPNMPSPPTFQKVNPADQPIYFLALSSNTLPISTVDEYAETLLGQRISMVKGVAQVQVFGSQKYAVRIQLDPQALASRQVGIDEVTAAVQNANVNLPTGTLFGKKQAFAVQANGQLTRASLYRPLIVAYRNGSPVRLDELGTVADSVQSDKISNFYNDEHAVILAVQRQPGTNTVDIVAGVKKILPQFKAILPPSVTMTEIYDRSALIRESVNDVKFTLLLAVCLVVLVIFLFLRNLSATVIPSIALPMSIVGTFAVMYLLNYTLDNLSLMALTLSVGFVVDDAIVMLENIVRHIEMGEGVMEAALKGSKEIGFTIVSMTLSLTAVFIPVLFMGGIIGRLLHEFSVVIMMAVLVSGFVSLTLTPMLCSRFVRSQHGRKHGTRLPGAGPIFRALAECVRREPAMGAAPAGARDGHRRGDSRHHRMAIHNHPQRVFAGSRFRQPQRLYAGGAGDFIRRDERASGRVGQSSDGRSESQGVLFQPGHGWRQQQLGLYFHAPEVAIGTARNSQCDDDPPRKGIWQRSRGRKRASRNSASFQAPSGHQRGAPGTPGQAC